MFHPSIWLGISFGIAGVIIAFGYTLYQILKDRRK